MTWFRRLFKFYYWKTLIGYFFVIFTTYVIGKFRNDEICQLFRKFLFIDRNFSFTALIGGSVGQEDVAALADSALHKASELTHVQGLNTSALPVEEAKTAFKKKCDKNGGATAYPAAESAAKVMESCVRGLVNVTLLQEEIEQAKPTGDLDIVFRKYCNKSPTLKNCVKNFTDTIGNCFTPKERENINIVQNITDQLLSFVCFKEGDRIARE